MAEVSSSPAPEQSQEVASKVLRRAQVSKMTRALQDRLALANVKMSRGWQNRSIDSIEPELELELKRKRADSNGDVYSDTSSNVSSRWFSSSRLAASSPLTGPFISDGITRSGSSQIGPHKRFRGTTQPTRSISSSQSHTKGRAAARAARATCKSAYDLPESSPSYKRSARKPITTDRTQFSFTSETSTILDISSASEDDDQDIPLHSFQFSDNQIASSPPRTPPPALARSARLMSKSFDTPTTEPHLPGKEGADLLLYLASSPSPAMRVNKTPMLPPSTPPSKHTPLPSSMMSTPGGLNFGFGPNTPSTAFNFADYVNITPSPAQGPWSKTPGTSRTPTVGTKRRLNFDSLMPPPGGSPNIGSLGRGGARGKGDGLGMELGGELVS